MRVYAFIVRLPFFLIGLLFYTLWQWGIIIYYTLLWALLWTAWGILMVVTTIDVHFFNTTDTPWHTIGEEIEDYGDTVKGMHGWLTEYTKSNRERLILWLVVILIGLVVSGIIGINKYNDFRTGQATINDFCQQRTSYHDGLNDLSPGLQSSVEGNGSLGYAYISGCSSIGTINDLHQVTIGLESLCGSDTQPNIFFVDATLVQINGTWKIDQLSPESPNPCHT